MNGTFKLSITLENDAMKDPLDVADALAKIAETIAESHNEGSIAGDRGEWPIMDLNGLKVGEYEFIVEDDDDDQAVEAYTHPWAQEPPGGAA